jgi:hypothetical protein
MLILAHVCFQNDLRGLREKSEKELSQLIQRANAGVGMCKT